MYVYLHQQIIWYVTMLAQFVSGTLVSDFHSTCTLSAIRSFPKFGKMFSESSTIVMQLPCCPGKQGELSEYCLQNLRNDLMAHSVYRWCCRSIDTCPQPDSIYFTPSLLSRDESAHPDLPSSPSSPKLKPAPPASLDLIWLPDRETHTGSVVWGKGAAEELNVSGLLRGMRILIWKVFPLVIHALYH